MRAGFLNHWLMKCTRKGRQVCSLVFCGQLKQFRCWMQGSRSFESFLFLDKIFPRLPIKNYSFKGQQSQREFYFPIVATVPYKQFWWKKAAFVVALVFFQTSSNVFGSQFFFLSKLFNRFMSVGLFLVLFQFWWLNLFDKTWLSVKFDRRYNSIFL